MKTIPIRSAKIGDLVADNYQAILLAILEENEDCRLSVRSWPEGMCFVRVLILCALSDTHSHSGTDWLIRRLDGECVLCSEYLPATPPQSNQAFLTPSVHTAPCAHEI